MDDTRMGRKGLAVSEDLVLVEREDLRRVPQRAVRPQHVEPEADSRFPEKIADGREIRLLRALEIDGENAGGDYEIERAETQRVGSAATERDVRMLRGGNLDALRDQIHAEVAAREICAEPPAQVSVKIPRTAADVQQRGAWKKRKVRREDFEPLMLFVRPLPTERLAVHVRIGVEVPVEKVADHRFLFARQ